MYFITKGSKQHKHSLLTAITSSFQTHYLCITALPAAPFYQMTFFIKH